MLYVKEEITDTLRGIELTKEAGMDFKEVEFITNKDRAKELDDPVRIHILRILREGIEDTITSESVDDETGEKIIRQKVVRRHALSVVEIVKLSKEIEDVEEITKNQVYHHLPKLIENGFVIKFGTVQKGERKTNYYRRTADGFIVTTGPLTVDKSIIRKRVERFTNKLCGTFNLDISEEDKSRIKKLLTQLYLSQIDSRKAIGRIINADIANKEVLNMFELLVEIHSFGSADTIQIYKSLREIFFPGE